MRNWLEWIVFCVCAVIVLGVAGALIYDATQNGQKRPMVRVELGEAEQSGNVYLVPVTVQNEGDQSAEEVEVEVAAGGEKSSLTFQFLPRRSQRKGWVAFEEEPSEPLARIVGFREP